jgi:hypothetical protein
MGDYLKDLTSILRGDLNYAIKVILIAVAVTAGFLVYANLNLG